MRKIAILLCLLALPLVAAASPCCSLGDVNTDGSVSTADLSKLSQYCQGLTSLTITQLNNANVDGDNNPCNNLISGESDDLRLIRDYILGIDETFPRCGDLNGDGEWGWNSSDPNDDDDWVILSGHILGTNPITDTTTKRNADSNQSCTLTTLDAIGFRKLELGTSTTITNCQSQNSCSY